MKILYCSYSQIPSDYANSIAVMQQCSALNKKAELFALFVRDHSNCHDVFKHYNVDPFPLKLLPKTSLCFGEVGLKISLLQHVLLKKADVIYSRDVLLNRFMCRLHIPNIYEIHQIDQENQKFDRCFKRKLLAIKDNRYLCAIVCISDALKRECLKFGIPEEKLIVLHSAVSIKSGHSSSNNKGAHILKEDRPIAMYVGSLQRGKGIDMILRMAELSDRYHFVIVGGKTGTILESEQLTHIPQVSNEQAREYMKSADFLLLPMTKQKYKFHSPLKLFEYLCAGKVLIASENEDLTEVLQHRENAMLANSDDPLDFLKQMDIVCNDPDLRKRLCKQAYQTALIHSWDHRAIAICNLIKEKLS